MKIKALPKVEVVDLIDHKTLLFMFRDYVNECIDEYTHSNKVRPLSFDEWHNREYLVNRDTLTTVIDLSMNHETAANGFLTGTSPYKGYKVRIPAGIVIESGGIVDINGLKKFAKAFADKMNERMPRVMYRDKLVYAWSWD